MVKKMRKKQLNAPRHKRAVKKPGRLNTAKHWLAKYEGRNLVRGYSKHFGVSLLGAVAELEELGFKTDPEYVKQLRQSEPQEGTGKEARSTSTNASTRDES